MSATTTIHTAPDGTPLAVHMLGEGRPVLLLHGLFSSAQTNWIKFGHAERIAAAGFRVIMPDTRAHGDSGAPHEPACYPSDVALDDVRFLIEQLELTDFDLGGFSLGARMTVRLLEDGVTPLRAIVAGMGLEGLAEFDRRRQFFLDALAKADGVRRGDPHWFAVQFARSNGIDPVAARLLLDSFTVEPPRLDFIATPVLVVCGTEDTDNGSAPTLAQALPNATYAPVPGTHMSSVTQPELGEAMAAFLAG